MNYECYLIKQWIINENHEFLDIYLKYRNKNDVVKISYYELAIEHNNYNSFIILFDNDNNDKNEIIYELVKKDICMDFLFRQITVILL